MPDISMCQNNTCPSRKSCYRHTADPDEYMQAYACFEVKEGSNRCDNYWDNEEYEQTN